MSADPPARPARPVRHSSRHPSRHISRDLPRDSPRDSSSDPLAPGARQPSRRTAAQPSASSPGRAPFVPIVPAGGAGTRLWPLSRSDRPKFLLDLTGAGRSLLQATLDRLEPLADAPCVVVTGSAHAAAVREQVGDGEDQPHQPHQPDQPSRAGARARVLVEPTPRNSMPAIALAAAHIEREHPGAVIGSFAADHLIGEVAPFHDAVRAAREVAEQGYLVTLGIRPRSAATGFGYIQRSTRAPQGAEHVPGAVLASAFVEKPDRERAEAFLADGMHLWNAGMFIARADVLLDSLAQQIPSLAEGARRIAAGGDIEQIWPSLTSIAIDHALAEPLAAAGRVAVVPADLDWDDVGDFAALSRQLRSQTAGEDVRILREGGSDVRVLGPMAVEATGSRATVYGSSHRLLALVGVDGISVVDTEDALLVIADDRAQDLGGLVSSWLERGTIGDGVG